jgi:glycosyltransferase involved in cell wall biosynthesis
MIGDIKVSACIIAKNEEENLPRLLESIKNKFYEIVLVDTGSTDKTVEIAKKYGAKVYHRQWNGFADARQYAVDMATGDWIWFFDADCELEEEEYERFKRILLTIKDNPEYEGIGVVYKNLGKNGELKGLSSTVHIHKKHPDLVWEGKIHERVFNKKTNTILIPPFKVSVLHYGYADFQTQICKAKRNLKLIFQELRTLKKTDYTYYVNIFYIVQSYNVLYYLNKEKYLRKSLRYIKKFLEYSDNMDNKSTFKKHFFVYAGRVYYELKEYEKALELLEKAIKIDECYPDYNYLLYLIYRTKNEEEKAVKYGLNYLRGIDKNRENYGIISDFLLLRHQVIDEIKDHIKNNQEYQEHLNKIWKEEKGENIGRLVFKVLKEKSPKEAEKIIKKVAVVYNSDEAYTDIGEFYFENKKYQKATEFFIKSLDINPNNIKAFRYLFEIYKNYGDYEKAFYHGLKYINESRDLSFLSHLEELKSADIQEKLSKIKEKIKV